LLLQRESGLSYAEIAVVMDISESTVKTHIARALAVLREKLAPWREMVSSL
jgi:DNA-directed RNA polymerase specialized sigma24 family protein